MCQLLARSHYHISTRQLTFLALIFYYFMYTFVHLQAFTVACAVQADYDNHNVWVLFVNAFFA